MTNVNGNVFGGQSKSKALTLVKGKRGRLKTHNIPRVKKGIAFQDKAYKWGASAKAGAQKVYGNIGRSYKRYGKPTETIFRRIGSTALGAGKLALRFPGTGLVATGLYAGAKHLGKKWGRGYHYSAVRQFDKKGRKIL